MKCYWLSKKENKNFLWFKPKKRDLIVFFAGWSFDYKAFSNNSENYDILIIYDYNDLTIPDELKNLNTENYKNKYLISWSMGVYIAYKFRKLFQDFNRRIAINGTTTPVDDEYGIPVKMFELTLKHAAKGLEGKFYQNVFNNTEDLELFNITPIERSIENRVSELENLYNLIKNENEDSHCPFYDYAIVGDADKIIPPKNQIASHKKNNVPTIELECGHFPFYTFLWKDYINVDRIQEYKKTI